MLPTDRSGIATEARNPQSLAFHRSSVAECVQLIHRENARVQQALEGANAALIRLIEEIEPHFLAGGRVIYLGAGTSGRLGVLDAAEVPPTFQVAAERFVGLIAGGDQALRRSSEGKEDEWDGAYAALDALALTANDSVIGIAAGGTTPYVLGGLDHVASMAGNSPVTGLISCSPMAKPERIGHLIVLDCGPEVITGSTRMKAGTATKLALNTISTTVMVRSGKVYENLMVDVRASNQKLRDRAARIVSTLTGINRNEAFALLDHADGSAKTAVVMQRLGCTRDEALARLEAAAGRLDRILD